MGGIMTKDPTMAVVLSLGASDISTGQSKKASVFSKRQAVHRTITGRADSPQDASALVMEEHGWLDDRRGASALKRKRGSLLGPTSSTPASPRSSSSTV
ncbi:hypothetical protein AB5J72_10210 [Streptomyces sp. CG1]|uniref:hypothetical protein n=1 Tax=Streptomyces sp. CG1 TaxID=1287523 RepID=UPI0034E2EFFD